METTVEFPFVSQDHQLFYTHPHCVLLVRQNKTFEDVSHDPDALN